MRNKVNRDDIEDMARGILMGKTIRQVADECGMSKSTVHNHIHKYGLEILGTKTYYDVLDMLQYNFKQKHIRGGQATSKKWADTKVATKNYYKGQCNTCKFSTCPAGKGECFEECPVYDKSWKGRCGCCKSTVSKTCSFYKET